MSRWGDEKTSIFLTLYREQPCLWNISSPLYKNKIARENAYKLILEQMNDPNLTIKVIKNEIKNLRSTYHQELKKVKESSRTGAGSSDVYKPSLFWFDEVNSFLGDTVETRNTIASSLDTDSSNCSENHIIQQSQNLEPTHESVQPRRNNPDSTNHPQERSTLVHADATTMRQVKSKSRTQKRRCEDSDIISALQRLENISQVINNIDPKPVKDEFHYFAMNVAEQLRKLPIHVALKMQAEIQTKLLIARTQAQVPDTATISNTNSPSSHGDLYEMEVQNDNSERDKNEPSYQVTYTPQEDSQMIIIPSGVLQEAWSNI